MPTTLTLPDGRECYVLGTGMVFANAPNSSIRDLTSENFRFAFTEVAVPPRVLERLLVAIRRDDRAAKLLGAISRAVIAQEAPGTETDPLAERLLSVSLRGVLVDLASTLQDVNAQPREAPDLLPHDGALARCLTALQTSEALHAVEALRRIREPAWTRASGRNGLLDVGETVEAWSEALKLWVPNERKAFEFIARALWRGTVRQQYEHAPTPALGIDVTEKWQQLSQHRATRVAAAGDKFEIISERESIAEVDIQFFLPTTAFQPSDLFTRIDHHTRELHRVAADAGFRDLIRTGHFQKACGATSPNVIRFEHGVQGWAKKLGYESSGQARETLMCLLRAMAGFKARWPGIGEVGGLLTFHAVDEAPGRPTELVVTLSDVLMPFDGLDTKDQGRRQKVPILPMPKFVGSPNTHGAQCAFQTAIARELLESRKQLLYGGALIEDGRFAEMARQFGLPEQTRTMALAAWTQPGPDGWLVREGQRFHLADHSPELKRAKAWMDEAARRTQSGPKSKKRGRKP